MLEVVNVVHHDVTKRETCKGRTVRCWVGVGRDGSEYLFKRRSIILLPGHNHLHLTWDEQWPVNEVYLFRQPEDLLPKSTCRVSGVGVGTVDVSCTIEPIGGN